MSGLALFVTVSQLPRLFGLKKGPGDTKIGSDRVFQAMPAAVAWAQSTAASPGRSS